MTHSTVNKILIIKNVSVMMGRLHQTCTNTLTQK